MNTELKNLSENIDESGLITSGEKIEQDSFKVISNEIGDHLPEDGNIYFHEISPNCLALISSCDVFVGNRVMGIGLDEKITNSLLKKTKDFYFRNKKEKFIIQLSPAKNNLDVSELLLHNGGEVLNNWAKFVKIPEGKNINSEEITIRESQKDEHESIASLLLKSFHFPEELRAFILPSFGKPGWKNYVAMLGGKIAGTGSLYIKDKIAEIGFAATAEDARGKGVQTALINFRENIAYENGCDHMFVETAEPTASYPAPSYRNMIRLGFTELYKRPNYLFKS